MAPMCCWAGWQKISDFPGAQEILKKIAVKNDGRIPPHTHTPTPPMSPHPHTTTPSTTHHHLYRSTHREENLLALSFLQEPSYKNTEPEIREILRT